MFTDPILTSATLCAIAATLQTIHLIIKAGVVIWRFLKSKNHK